MTFLLNLTIEVKTHCLKLTLKILNVINKKVSK